MNVNLEEMSMTIQVQAMETFDEFIFQTIEPYCEQVMRRKISKKVLEQALTEYFEKHPQNQD